MCKNVSHYIKKSWKLCALACACLIVRWGLTALMQLVMARSVTSAMQFDLRGFLAWTAANFGLWGANSGISALGTWFQARAVRDMNNRVRHDLYLSLLAKGHREFHSRDTGEYLSWLTGNIKQIERLAWTPFFDCVGRTAHIVWCVLALASFHWAMLAAGLVSAGVMILAPRLFEKRMAGLGAACTAAEAEGTGRLKDLLCGFDVLRSFGQTDRFLRQGDACSDRMEEPNCRRSYVQFNLNRAVSLAATVMQILQEVLAVVLAIRGEVIMGALASAGNLTAGITSGLNSIANDRMSMASARSCFAHITVRAGNAPSPAEPDAAPLRQAITVENLSFGYGDRPVLQNLSLRFEVGGKYAVTGPSGCGKSTLLKLLLGWLPDYGGTIRFDGKDARDFTPEQRQRQMSYIEQNVFLFASTLRDNITLGEAFTDGQMEKALRDSALAGDLDSLPEGLDTAVGEGGGNLSGGQKQRAAIARALIHSRSILLVDEGTSALDQRNADIVERSLLDNPDLTLILVSHHLTPERKAQFTRVYELRPGESAGG